MNLKSTIKEVIQAILPLAMVIILFQFTSIRIPVEDFLLFLLGVLFAFVGFVLFLIGARVSVLPMGETFGASLAQNEKIWLLIGLGISLGFAVTISEPGLKVLANQVSDVSNGEIPKNLLMITVSLGLGIFLALSLMRVLFNISLRLMILASYIIAFFLAMFSSPEFFAVSFDAGGVATGPMTVPFIIALGVGLSSVRGTKSASSDSFGFVGLAYAGPILSVLLLGMIYR